MSDAPSPPEPPDAPRGFDRRALIAGGLAAGAAVTIAGLWFEGFGNPWKRRGLVRTPAGEPGRTFDAAEWAALEAAYDRILPSAPGSPGARDVNAIGYLDAAMLDPDLDPVYHLDVVRSGVPRLEQAARAKGAASFAALAPETQDEVLKGLEAQPPGVKWLRKMTWFGLEALLGDPVHGCQPGEVGWKWLGVVVDEPRPHVANWKPVPR